MPSNSTVPKPPEAWAPAERLAARVLGPIERFLHAEAASGIVLLVAALVAIVWANSPYSASYDHLWHTPVTLGVGRFLVTPSLHFVINEALMTVFFLVVGLEIRREIHAGELSDLRRAALPAACAVGGMVAPALIYLQFAGAGEARRGWGVPTATDIAFAVGVLALLGKRVPAALRVLLLALAIIDDIGAIVVIAVFYSSGVVWTGLAIAGAGLVGVIVLQWFGVRRSSVYVIPGAVVWLGMYRAGVHPTIAGVLLGLLTPTRPRIGEEHFLTIARGALDDFRETSARDHGEQDLLGPLGLVRLAQHEALSPVVRLQAMLHPWVAYVIMPLFALANAGVSVRGLSLDDPATRVVALGVCAGLVLGKPLGIFVVAFVTVKLRICALPRGVSWAGILVVGAVAGIGFTMAIFIAGLAFTDAASLGAAKLGILAASFTAGVLGLALGRVVLRPPADGRVAITATEAEASTEL